MCVCVCVCVCVRACVRVCVFFLIFVSFFTLGTRLRISKFCVDRCKKSDCTRCLKKKKKKNSIVYVFHIDFRR